jgi:hypothetical protein
MANSLEAIPQILRSILLSKQMQPDYYSMMFPISPRIIDGRSEDLGRRYDVCRLQGRSRSLFAILL